MYSKVLLPQIQTCEFSLDKKKIIYDGSFISKMFRITPFPNVLVNLDFCIGVAVDWNHGEHHIPTFHVRKELRLGRQAEGQGQAVVVFSFPSIGNAGSK